MTFFLEQFSVGRWNGSVGESSDEYALVFANVESVVGRQRFKGDERWAAAVLKKSAAKNAVGR